MGSLQIMLDKGQEEDWFSSHFILSLDYWGIGLLVVGMGSLQIMLDKGQEEDWFASHFILVLAVLAVIGLGGLVIRELRAEHPVIDLSVFRYRSYAVGTFLMTTVGFVH